MGCLETVSLWNKAVAYLALVTVHVFSQCTLAIYIWLLLYDHCKFGMWSIMSLQTSSAGLHSAEAFHTASCLSGGLCDKLGLPLFLTASLFAQRLLLYAQGLLLF